MSIQLDITKRVINYYAYGKKENGGFYEKYT